MFVEIPRRATCNSVNVRELFSVSSRTIRSVQWSPISLDALSKECRRGELRLIVICGNHMSPRKYCELCPVVKDAFHYALTSSVSASSLGTVVGLTPNQIE